jgi:hypothetical protein
LWSTGRRGTKRCYDIAVVCLCFGTGERGDDERKEDRNGGQEKKIGGKTEGLEDIGERRVHNGKVVETASFP